MVESRPEQTSGIRISTADLLRTYKNVKISDKEEVVFKNTNL
jgi:hypothetical protein